MSDQHDTLEKVVSGAWCTCLPEHMRPAVAKLVIYSVLVALVIGVAPFLDSAGGEALDESFTRAISAFAAARGLDSLISLAQSSELSFSFGPGGSIGIGQALDPVNDLVEQYASLLLTSTTALGVQQLGLRIGQSLGVYFFVPSFAMLLFSMVVKGKTQKLFQTWGHRLFAVALFARLAIPATAWMDAMIAERFMETSYQDASMAIETTTEKLQQAETVEAEKPWYDRYNLVNATRERAQEIYESISRMTESIVNLAVYFTISTIVLPLGTLWVLSKLVGALFASRQS